MKNNVQRKLVLVAAAWILYHAIQMGFAQTLENADWLVEATRPVLSSSVGRLGPSAGKYRSRGPFECRRCFL